VRGLEGNRPAMRMCSGVDRRPHGPGRAGLLNGVLRVPGSAVVARAPLGPAEGGGEAASPDLPGAPGSAAGSAVYGELDAAGVAEV
jgi:hypothetical protein